MSHKSNKTNTCDMRERQKALIENLVLVNFPIKAMENKYRIKFFIGMFDHPNNSGFEIISYFLFVTLNEARATELFRIKFFIGMFDHPNNSGFEIISYFLFVTLNEARATELFRHCYPTMDKKSVQMFRTVCLNWWKDIIESNPSANIPKVSLSMLMTPGGPQFVKFLLSFSTFVLWNKEININDDGNTLLPVIKNKSLHRAQIRTLASACHSESREAIHNIQVMRHSDIKAMEMADSLVKEYRSLISRKKVLLESIGKLNLKKRDVADQKSPSTAVTWRLKSPSFKSYQSKVTNSDDNRKKLQKVQSMWKPVIQAGTENEVQHDIIHSVLLPITEKNLLLASLLSPRVPSSVLNHCSPLAYEKIGTSLFHAGQLNLNTSISLFNVGLHILIECLHEGITSGSLNFEKLSDLNAKVLIQIHSKNIETVKSICKSVRFMLLASQKSVQHLTQTVDEERASM